MVFGIGAAEMLLRVGREMSSEIPDAKKLELSRLANPAIQERKVEEKKPAGRARWLELLGETASAAEAWEQAATYGRQAGRRAL